MLPLNMKLVWKIVATIKRLLFKANNLLTYESCVAGPYSVKSHDEKKDIKNIRRNKNYRGYRRDKINGAMRILDQFFAKNLFALKILCKIPK